MAGEHILVVDDEPEIVRLYSLTLEQEGYKVRGASSGQSAIAALQAETFDLLVIDLKMPDLSGLAVLNQAREIDPHLAAVVITGYAIPDLLIKALHAGVQGFLFKPFGPEELIAEVQAALAHRQKEEERLSLRAQLPILKIGQTLMAEGNVESIAGPLLETVARQVGADRALLLMLDEKAGLFQPVGAVGLPAGQGEIWQIPMPSHSDPILSQGKPVVVDADSWSRLEPPCHHLLAGPATEVVCVPLQTRGRSVGLLAFTRPEQARSRLSAATDLNLLSILGRQIATTLDNVHLYEEVKAARDYARTLVNSLHDGIFVLNRDLTIVDVNDAAVQRMGYSREEMVGRPCYQVIHRRDRPCNRTEYPCPAAEVWATGQSVQSLHIHPTATGERLYVEVTAAPLRDKQGQIAEVVEVHRDVTAEWRLESVSATIREMGQALVLSRDESQIAEVVVSAAERLLDFRLCGLWLVDQEKKLLVRQAATAAVEAIAPRSLPLDGERGITVAVARSGQAIYVPDTQQDPRYIESGFGSRSELCVPLKVGNRVLGVLNAESTKPNDFDQADRRLLSSLADQAALALENARLFGETRRLKEFNENLVQNMGEGIVMEDQTGRILFMNRAGAAMLGYEPQELVGRHWQELAPPEHHPTLEAAHERRRRGEANRYELALKRRDGSSLPVLMADQPLSEGERITGSLAVFSDLTEVKRLQTQLIQSEKMAALGRLAASLAHEINNPLQALRSGLRLLAGRSLKEEKRQQYVRVIQGEVERLVEIVERTLNFYRPAGERRRPTDINAILEETLALAGKQLQHRRVTVSYRLGRRLPLVDAVDGQIKQVFLNIIFNALDAMPNGGDLIIETGWDDRRREVWTTFVDSGEGIPANVLEQIWDPFYTSKPQGTGLGLAISRGIVEQHGGRIEVASTVGVGSKFTVFLPALTAPTGLGK